MSICKLGGYPSAYRQIGKNSLTGYSVAEISEAGASAGIAIGEPKSQGSQERLPYVYLISFTASSVVSLVVR